MFESRACESILTAQEKSIPKNVTASATSFFDKENCCISAKDGKCINGFIRYGKLYWIKGCPPGSARYYSPDCEL